MDLLLPSIKEQRQDSFPYRKKIKGLENPENSLMVFPCVLFLFCMLSFTNLANHCRLTCLALRSMSHRQGYLDRALRLTEVRPAWITPLWCAEEEWRATVTMHSWSHTRWCRAKTWQFLLPGVHRIAWVATPQDLPEHINGPGAAHCLSIWLSGDLLQMKLLPGLLNNNYNVIYSVQSTWALQDSQKPSWSWQVGHQAKA